MATPDAPIRNESPGRPRTIHGAATCSALAITAAPTPVCWAQGGTRASSQRWARTST